MPTPEALAWIRDRWIPALRSGEYAQGQGMLRQDNDTYCCLGVGCDLAVKDGMIPDWENEDGYFIPLPSNGSQSAYTLLPDYLATYLSIGHSGTVPVNGHSYSNLAGANDQGVGFAQIADALESWCDEQEA